MTHPTDCNAYLVRCGGEYVMIDAGSGIEPGLVFDTVFNDGIGVGSVRTLLLTHYHLDHAGGASQMRGHYYLQVWAGPLTAPVLSSGDEEAISLGAAKRAGVYPRDVKFVACPVNRVLEPGVPLEIGDSKITPIAAPGHSSDMICYLVQQPNRTMLFSGDALFQGGRISLQDTWDCDVPAYTRSLRAIHGLDFDMMFPGHGLWTLSNARREIQTAMSYLNRLLLPPSL